MNAIGMVKLMIDLLMSLVLLMTMGYSLWGNFLHELFGILLLLLLILHHALNRYWYKTVLKGRYTPYRRFILILNILLTFCMLGLGFSGIMVSKHIFAFLDINSGMSFARLLHLSLSHWSFVLMVLHIGLHINPRLQRLIRKNKSMRISLCFLAIISFIFGSYALIKRDFISYMLLKTQFAFIDFSESVFEFYIDYLMITGMIITAGYFLNIGLTKGFKRKIQSR